MKRGALALAILLVPGARADELEGRRRALDFGLWNQRINALYDAGEAGASGLPLLVYAADDADWQVRLTAVHFMGKLGPRAARALGDVARDEPCINVRVSAYRWLTGMGEEGRRVLKESLTPEDEREMAAVPDRFGTERMGKPLAIDPPEGEMTAAFFDGGLDLRACASSEHAGRRRRAPAASEAAAAPEPPETFEPVATPPVRPPDVPRLPEAPPSGPVALVEPEGSRPRRVPEAFPPAGPGLGAREASPGSADYARAPGPRPAEGASPRAPLPPGEAMPQGPAGLDRAAPASGEAALVDDAGTGKPENDPVPALIERLSAREARVRARAADELGKRGTAAVSAVPALRRALKDRDRRVRASAVLALGGVAGGEGAVVSDLRRALRDKNEDVRFSAVIALERLGKAPRK